MQSRRPAGLGIALFLLVGAVAAPPVAAADASLRIEPATVAVAKGASFTVKVVQDAPVATSGAQASIVFDPTVLQVESVAPGSAYATATIFLPMDIQADIRNANATGRLAQVAAAYTPPAAVPAGAAGFLVIRFRVVGCGQTDITLPVGGPYNAQMISGQADVYGHEVPVATASGRVTTCVGPDAVTIGSTDPTPGDTVAGGTPLGLIGAGAVIAVGLVGAFAWRLRRAQPAA